MDYSYSNATLHLLNAGCKQTKAKITHEVFYNSADMRKRIGGVSCNELVIKVV